MKNMLIALALLLYFGASAQTSEREYRLGIARGSSDISDVENQFRHVMKLNPHDTAALKELAKIYVKYTYPAFKETDKYYQRVDTALSVCDTLLKWDASCKACLYDRAMLEKKKAEVVSNEDQKLKFAQLAVDDLKNLDQTNPAVKSIKAKAEDIINAIKYKD